MMLGVRPTLRIAEILWAFELRKQPLHMRDDTRGIQLRAGNAAAGVCQGKLLTRAGAGDITEESFLGDLRADIHAENRAAALFNQSPIQLADDRRRRPGCWENAVIDAE